jgi:rsbT co-antagonist protein RsbR
MSSIGQVLDVLGSVSQGDLSQRLELDYDGDHPVGVLGESVNSMIEALSEARGTTEERLAELNQRIDVIEAQREAIRNLTVPVIEVWRSVLCVPIVGVLDSMHASDLTMVLLEKVARLKARYVIIDVTGIDAMDTTTADHFMRMARAITLLGSTCALSGVRPAIASTMVHIGVEMGEIKTYRTMRDALKEYVRRQPRPRSTKRNTDEDK